jgi:hypothetical protein
MLKKLLSLLRHADPPQAEFGDVVVAEYAPKVAGHIGNRRATNFWEPIYGPEVTMVGEPYDWDLERGSDPTRRFIPGAALTEKIRNGETLTVKNIAFRECDFQGRFQATTIVMFDGCQFIGCDFAYSVWNSAHFKNCTFTASSLAMATFEKCEFRGCSWERIGVSGNKTDLVRTFIENPKALVAAMTSGLDPKKATSKEHVLHQWYRLGGTRAHVLRSIMLSHATVGDEHVYYRTVELHELQRNFARLQEDWYHLRFSPGDPRRRAFWQMPFHAVNLALMWAFGLTNGWGESVSQPSVLFGAVYGVFGLIYALVPFSPPIDHPWQKSFDITFLIGFTNHSHADQGPLTLVQDVHAVLAVILYTVFFSTLISKLSRTR